MINKAVSNPRILFLTDGLGALLSAVLLGLVLTRLVDLIGMPVKTLYFLAFLPCLFAVYDLICFLKIKEKWRTSLKVIALANTTYCVISVGFMVHHYSQLTRIGVTYFVLEIVIVAALAMIEFRTAEKLTI